MDCAGVSTGSSPPVRGARAHYCVDDNSIGLIPARAGSTLNPYDASLPYKAHPRPCGEHKKIAHLRRPLQGSSPPVRGALGKTSASQGVKGLIPARAGSTSATTPISWRTGAHPRPCGEHVDCSTKNVPPLGSSPPVRGAQCHSRRRTMMRGLIPARAGSTAVLLLENPNARAHPRPCGEHTHIRATTPGIGGSSPPVRGARVL